MAREPGSGSTHGDALSRVAPTTETVIDASPHDVFDVLTDPLTYPDWLVGAQRIRDVEHDWPRVGSRFHHMVGFGPARLAGSTSVRRCDAPHELLLGAGIGPLGEATVRFRLDPVEAGTRVRLDELPARGLVRLVWRIGRPVVAAALWGRNAVSLAGLTDVVRSRAGGHV